MRLSKDYSGKRFAANAMMLMSGILPFTAHAAEKSFNVLETSISDIHQAMKSGDLTCHDLVKQYLDRIQAYDKQGPALNAILYLNPNALAQADEMDRDFHRTGKMKRPAVHSDRAEGQ